LGKLLAFIEETVNGNVARRLVLAIEVVNCRRGVADDAGEGF
jgi:hypothetical protein